ncbi:8-amino-7-oxononanoate synthase [Vibrio parahaemolyticus]
MTQRFKERVSAALRARQQSELLRSVHILENGNRSTFQKGEEQFVNFSSNDYLGLASSDELKDAYQTGISLFGVGSGASPLVTGYSAQHESLKSELTEWLGFEEALFFSSGFSANQAVLFSLMHKGDLLLQDRLNHASLMEAGSLCDADMRRFRHNDLSHLQSLIKSNVPVLAVTESVFSMDGDQSDVDEFLAVCRASGTMSMIDDAHGVGVIGKDGAGVSGLSQDKPDILIVTFGKAFGLNGAAVLCSKDLANYLTQFARHYIYSTAFSAAHAYALSKALNMIKTQHWRRDKLNDLASVYDESLGTLSAHVTTGTPIKPWILGETSKAQALCHRLKQKGIWTTAIRPPTVPDGSARLRITLSASHQESDVLALASQLKRFTEES